jgi:hypothetical protein
MGFRIRADTKAAKLRLRKIKTAMGRPAVTRVVAKVAQVARLRLIKQTPKKWTGQTRRGWQAKKRAPGHFMVYNESKVMGYLERGTRAHGPTTAKFLFIPLTRRAFNAGAHGVFKANLAAHRRGLGLNAPGSRKFVIGRDFVLTKRVKGIQARWIVRRYAPFARITLKAAMRLHIRNAMR